MEEVRGKLSVLRFDGKRCIHSRQCVLSRPDVFVPNVEGEWIHPDAATPEEIAKLAESCPSGAITYERLDGGPSERAPLVNLVTLRENGPLAFRAPMSLQKPDGTSESALRATLCRCGHSKNKPFCDGAHAGAGFHATGEPETKASEALASRHGPLAVEPTQDGPLHVTGNLEIVSGTGRTLNRTTDAWLCRCGHSKNKPYCDGSHRKAGWKSE